MTVPAATQGLIHACAYGLIDLEPGGMENVKRVELRRQIIRLLKEKGWAIMILEASRNSLIYRVGNHDGDIFEGRLNQICHEFIKCSHYQETQHDR